MSFRMRMELKTCVRILRGLALWMASSGLASAGPSDFKRDVLPVLETFCFDCHGDEAKPKGGVNLERFRDDQAIMRERSVWGAVYEKLESLQMPPPKGDSLPSAEERSRVLAWLGQIAARPDAQLKARDPGKPVLRRLTRLEYNNTVRDLFGLEMDVFMFPERLPVANKNYFKPVLGGLGEVGQLLEAPVREFGAKYPVLLSDLGLPGENRAEHGFRNRGDGMNLSPMLMEQYLGAAREIVRSPKLFQLSSEFRALVTDPAIPVKAAAVAEAVTPEPVSGAPIWNAVSEFAPNFNLPLQAKAGDVVTVTYQFRFSLVTAMAEGTGGVWDAAARNLEIAAGTPIRIQFGRDNRKSLVISHDQALWVTGFSSVGETSGQSLFTNQQKNQKKLTFNFEIQGGAPGEALSELALCVLSRDQESGTVELTGRFSGGGTAKLSQLLPRGAGLGNTFFAFRAPPGEHIVELIADGSKFSGSYLLLDDLGFLTNGGSTTSKLPAAGINLSAQQRRSVARERLQGFLPRVFRHTIEERTLGRYLGIFEELAGRGASFETAMKETLAAALASPEFLYLAEKSVGRESVRALNEEELATRLSYFLWSAPPDESLRAAATNGQLHTTGALEVQTQRMLKDARIRELSESFATQWLRLDQLYTTKPDPKQFKAFYSGPQGKVTLHSSMLMEALLLFETVLVENRSVLEFVDADYTWLNLRLVKLYGLESACAAQVSRLSAKGSGDDSVLKTAKLNDTWFRVRLPDKRRGGYLTMAGPLTVTSLPYRTSTVKRGAWLLETIFNRPPQEPKVAFVLKENEKVAKVGQTVRQRFEDHRNQAACYSCHIRLDPPGFALESFDPIGAWRTKDGTQAVDAHGQWNGHPFDGPAGFKAALLIDQEQFVRGFIEHLLSYALGRKLEFFDQPAIAQIQNAAAADGYRLQQIISEIVKSYPFRFVRNASLDPIAR